MKDRNVFKCEIKYLPGKIKITSYYNRQIPASLLLDLNTAVHEIADKYNGKLNWRKQYIAFTQDGIRYRQVDNVGTRECPDICCFYKNHTCTHPHYLDETKGDCTHKHYIIDKSEESE